MVVFQPTLLLQGLYLVEAILVLLKIFCPCIYSTSHPPASLLRFLSLQRSHTTWWWSGTMLPLRPFIMLSQRLEDTRMDQAGITSVVIVFILSTAECTHGQINSKKNQFFFCEVTYNSFPFTSLLWIYNRSCMHGDIGKVRFE